MPIAFILFLILVFVVGFWQFDARQHDNRDTKLGRAYAENMLIWHQGAINWTLDRLSANPSRTNWNCQIAQGAGVIPNFCREATDPQFGAPPFIGLPTGYTSSIQDGWASYVFRGTAPGVGCDSPTYGGNGGTGIYVVTYYSPIDARTRGGGVRAALVGRYFQEIANNDITAGMAVNLANPAFVPGVRWLKKTGANSFDIVNVCVPHPAPASMASRGAVLVAPGTDPAAVIVTKVR